MSNHERLKHLKESLMGCIENQMCNIYEVDAEELGEAIDMLKDIEEAMYYCTITEAMQGGGEGKKNHGNYEFEIKNEKNYGKSHDQERMYYPYPMMYMDDSRMYSDGNGSHNGGSRMYTDGNSSSNSSSSGSNGNTSYYSEPMRDPREGRSPESRRMYMEAKQMHHDKATQLRELEKYMQELTTDMVEMISDASTEEKQYLEKKMNTLAAKIGQMK